MINMLLLDAPENILINTIGTGTWEYITIEQLVAENSYFKLIEGKLYIETIDASVLVTGTVDGVPYSQTFPNE